MEKLAPIDDSKPFTSVFYAVQMHDGGNLRKKCERICGDDRGLLSRKSIKSLLTSIKTVLDFIPKSQHRVLIVNDHCSDKTINYVKKLQSEFTCNNIQIEIHNTEDSGFTQSLRKCWEFMGDCDSELVYQVQDDYIFEPTAIFEMIDIFNGVKKFAGLHAFVQSTNPPHWWFESYLFKYTLRTILLGRKQYWLQALDTPCTFMTSRREFNKHWDLYNKFLSIDPSDPKIEILSINKILCFPPQGFARTMGIIPFKSVALHMQEKFHEEPYYDWKALWDSIEVEE